MKKVILGLALATMIISCKKETKGEEVKENTETVEPVPTTGDTVVKKTETTIDTLNPERK